jgi:hypothetical protein
VITLGFDIGLTGAVTAIYPNGKARIEDLPTVEDGASRRLDGRALILMLRDMVPPGHSVLALFEDIRPRPNASRGTTMHSEGSLMRSRGIVEAVLDVAQWKPRVVHPQTWQAFFSLRGKAAKVREKGERHPSTLKAIELYPEVAERLARVKDHNRGESLLIAHYGRWTFT